MRLHPTPKSKPHPPVAEAEVYPTVVVADVGEVPNVREVALGVVEAEYLLPSMAVDPVELLRQCRPSSPPAGVIRRVQQPLQMKALGINLL